MAEGDGLLSAAQAGGTYRDLADQAKLFEDPYTDLLEVDPIRWNPVGTQSRMERISNTLSDLYRQQGELQSTIARVGRSGGDEYKNARTDLYIVEGKIKALEKRWDTLKNRGYTKKQEWAHTP